MPEQKTAETFAQALQQAEQAHDVEPLVRLFADDAELSSPVRDRTAAGLDGAREFWRQYLGAFDEVRSEFERVIEHDGLAVLEWTSHAKLTNGQPLTYRGVSLLDVAADGKVARFRTYYDTAAFLPEGAKHRGH